MFPSADSLGPQRKRAGMTYRRSVAAFVTSLAACILAGIANAAEVPAEFVGMWRLVSHVQRYEDGTERPSPRSVAYITYSESGHMCFVSMAPDRPKWQSSNRPTAAEATAMMDEFAAYCATVEVNMREGFLLHHVNIDRSPNQVGITRKRWFTLDGNRLTLSTDRPELSPPMIASVLTWERIE